MKGNLEEIRTAGFDPESAGRKYEIPQEKSWNNLDAKYRRLKELENYEENRRLTDQQLKKAGKKAS